MQTKIQVKLQKAVRSAKTLSLAMFLAIVFFLAYVYFDINTINPVEKMTFDDKQSNYTIECDTLYWLMKNEHGRAIGSSPKNLEEFCGKNITVVAKMRLFYGRPLCRKTADPKWCKSMHIPVVDVQSIMEEPPSLNNGGP